MRDITFAVIMALGIMALCLCIANTLIGMQDSKQLYNAYSPFSVETVIHDR